MPWIWFLVFGPDPTADEGGAAHLWQLLLVAQVMAIGFFIVTVLPQKPKQGILVLVIQIVALLASAVPIFLLHL